MGTIKKKTAPKRRRSREMTAGEAAIESLKEAIRHARGEDVPGIAVHVPVDVAAVRKATGLSQAKFAERFGLDASAVRDWEQGRRTPERAAQVLLRVIANDPDAVERAIRRA